MTDTQLHDAHGLTVHDGAAELRVIREEFNAGHSPAARIAALEAENATLRAALNTAEGTVEGCRNMLVEYGTAQAYGVDFRQELTTLLASIRAALAGEKGA
mgnify:CR=1 FL=1